MKKFLAALLPLVMILSLVACSSSKKAETPAQETPKATEEAKPAETEKATEPAKTPEPEKATEPAKTPEPEKAAEPEKTAEPEKAAEPEKTPEPAKTTTSSKTTHIKFTLKNKEELGAVTSLKIVPTGTNGSGAANLVSEPAKGVVYLEGDIQTAEWYDVLIVFEQGGRKLVGIPAVFDKISLKDGGASVANEAAGVDYVTSMSGMQCQSAKFKTQPYDPPKTAEPAKTTEPAKTPEPPKATEPETPAAAKIAEVKFTLKNKESLGAVKAIKIVPTGADASGAASLITESVASGAEAADYYDIVVEFEQGTKTLAGVPAAFDKVSLKDGGASIADEANGVKYVTSQSGVECNSDNFKFQ